MPFVTFSDDYMLDQWGTNHGTYMSLHSAYSASGSNELTGGSYARIAITWSSASGSSKALSGTPYTFNTPASSTAAFIGFWDAVSSGNFSGMFPNGGASVYTFSAPTSTSTLLAPGSSYSANQTVVVFPTAGSVLPTGLTGGTIYYVKSPSSDSFQPVRDQRRFRDHPDRGRFRDRAGDHRHFRRFQRRAGRADRAD